MEPVAGWFSHKLCVHDSCGSMRPLADLFREDMGHRSIECGQMLGGFRPLAVGIENTGRQHRLGRLGSQRMTGRLEEPNKVRSIDGKDETRVRAELSGAHCQ